MPAGLDVPPALRQARRRNGDRAGKGQESDENWHDDFGRACCFLFFFLYYKVAVVPSRSGRRCGIPSGEGRRAPGKGDRPAGESAPGPQPPDPHARAPQPGGRAVLSMKIHNKSGAGARQRAAAAESGAKCFGTGVDITGKSAYSIYGKYPMYQEYALEYARTENQKGAKPS